MNYHCALCGRPMLVAAVFIGTMPVGPVCARRAGLVALSKKRAGLVSAGMKLPARARVPSPENLDLFAELAA